MFSKNLEAFWFYLVGVLIVIADGRNVLVAIWFIFYCHWWYMSWAHKLYHAFTRGLDGSMIDVWLLTTWLPWLPSEDDIHRWRVHNRCGINEHQCPNTRGGIDINYAHLYSELHLIWHHEKENNNQPTIRIKSTGNTF
jgi:hypothetical protein